LKLTKKFVFALALATLLPIIIFRFAGFSTRDKLEERIGRHASDGLLRAQKILKQMNYDLHQLTNELIQINEGNQVQQILQPYLRKYPHLLWSVRIKPLKLPTQTIGTTALVPWLEKRETGLLALDTNPPVIWLLDKNSETRSDRNIAAIVAIPFDQTLLTQLKINSGAQTAILWGDKHLISTLPRAEAESVRISESELSEAEMQEVESFTVSRQQLGEMAYTVGYLRLPLYAYSTSERKVTVTPSPALFALALPRTFVDQEIKEFDDNLMSFTVLMLLVASFIGLGLTAMTMRPIIQLIRGTEEVGRGNLEYQITIRQKDEMGELGQAFNQMVRLLKDRQRVRETFSKYVSERVAEKILSSPEGVPLQGERRPIAVLFADIRGFTALAERGNPEEIVAMLNDCFTQLIEITFQYEGTLDKFIGDCVMALFGAPIPFADSLERAISAALDMQDQMEQFNQKQRERNRPEIQ
ncbi:MAG: adenylate/guanylate cyclase domain-containing protein, partial [bacterium]|nr:adenylate/guanylate cyclase domain-containing protein [bacterium]